MKNGKNRKVSAKKQHKKTKEVRITASIEHLGKVLQTLKYISHFIPFFCEF